MHESWLICNWNEVACVKWFIHSHEIAVETACSDVNIFFDSWTNTGIARGIRSFFIRFKHLRISWIVIVNGSECGASKCNCWNPLGLCQKKNVMHYAAAMRAASPKILLNRSIRIFPHNSYGSCIMWGDSSCGINICCEREFHNTLTTHSAQMAAG